MAFFLFPSEGFTITTPAVTGEGGAHLLIYALFANNVECRQAPGIQCLLSFSVLFEREND